MHIFQNRIEKLTKTYSTDAKISTESLKFDHTEFEILGLKSPFRSPENSVKNFMKI